MMNCPSRRPAKPMPKPWDGTFVAHNADNNAASDNRSVRTDYAINAGSQRADQYFGGPGSLEQGDREDFQWHDLRWSNGISFERSEVKHASVSDGKSYTFLIGEKYVDPNHYTSGQIGADNESMFTGYNNDNYRSTAPQDPPLQDRAGVDRYLNFGSAHPGMLHFAFCDGSVRPINYSMDVATYSALGSRNGRELIQQGDF
jgi:prepilin-type processing-associated H-X9-DG protein